MYTTHCTMVIHSHSMTMWKDKKICGVNTKPCHKPYKFDLRSKVNVISGIINVQDTSFHSDRPMCQILYANIKSSKSYMSDTKTRKKSKSLTLMSSLTFHSDRPICQISYANVKASKSYMSDTKTRKKTKSLTLMSKVNVKSGSWMYTIHPRMMMDACSKYGKSMSNWKIVMGRTWKHVKNPLNLTLIGIMNVRDILSYGDTPMCQIL